MRRSYKYIAGASAAVLVAIGGAELRRSSSQPEGEARLAAPESPAASPPGVAAESATFVAGAAPMPEPAAGAELGADAVAARIDELTTRLADREAALAAMTATLAGRDASLDALTATLTRREAEIQTLRDELTATRERYAFDIELEAIKGRGVPAGAAASASGGASGGAGDAPVEAVLAVAEGGAVRPEAAGVLALTEIHFESGSSSLSPGGQVHAAAAAVMLIERPVVRVRLLGYADRVGRADRNRALAAARARAVADFLVRSGVAADILETAGMGEDELPVSTGDGVAEPLNRSVAIIAIPRPTS